MQSDLGNRQDNNQGNIMEQIEALGKVVTQNADTNAHNQNEMGNESDSCCNEGCLHVEQPHSTKRSHFDTSSYTNYEESDEYVIFTFLIFVDIRIIHMCANRELD